MRRISAILFFLLVAVPAACPAAPAKPDDSLALSARDALTSVVVEQTAVPGVEVFVSGIRFQDASRAAGGKEIVRVSLDGPVRSGRGIQFAMFVRLSNGDVCELRASADVSIQVPVVVSARNVSTGSVLGVDDLQLRRREYSASGEAMIHDPSEAIGKRVRWQLSGGVPVRREYLEDPEALKRGDSVLIEAETGMVHITGKGVALQSGRIGETVLVRSQLSGKEMAGRLAPGHVVRVD